MQAKIELEGAGEVEVFDVSLRQVKGTANWIGSFRLPSDKTGASLIKLDGHIKKRGICRLCLDDKRQLEIIIDKINPVNSEGPFTFRSSGPLENV